MTGVVVVGSLNADFVVRVPHLPASGETILGSDAIRSLGGKGANQAVAARRLGADVSLVACTGVDSVGEDMRLALKRDGVDVGGVESVEDAPTGMALIVVPPDGESAITVAPGANRLLAPDRVVDLLGEISDAAVLLQLEIPLATNLATARLGRRSGVPVILNTAPVPPVRDEDFHELLKSVDVLVANKDEALQLLTEPGSRKVADWREVAQELRNLGPPFVVVTLGDKGVVAASDHVTLAQPAFPVTSIDGTGAGDAFCGALAVFLAEGLDVEGALRFACASGALATTQVGAQTALPTRTEVTELLASFPAGA